MASALVAWPQHAISLMHIVLIRWQTYSGDRSF